MNDEINKNKKEEKVSYILDTDPFYDPDDLFAIDYLLKSGVKPDLIVTGDEVLINKRAKMIKWMLSEIGYEEIPVVAGPELLGKTRLFCEGFLLGKGYRASDNHDIVDGNTVDEIAKVVDASDKTIYMGIQALSNIGDFALEYPELCDRVVLYQMGGCLRDAKPEHNIKIDVLAARTLITSKMEKYFVTLDTTMNPVFSVNPGTSLYELSKEAYEQNNSESLIQQLMYQNNLEFNNELGFWTHMHDPLTLSVALGHDFVDFSEKKIHIDDRGIMYQLKTVHSANISESESKATEFMEHLYQTLRGE